MLVELPLAVGDDDGVELQPLGLVYGHGLNAIGTSRGDGLAPELVIPIVYELLDAACLGGAELRQVVEEGHEVTILAGYALQLQGAVELLGELVEGHLQQGVTLGNEGVGEAIPLGAPGDDAGCGEAVGKHGMMVVDGYLQQGYTLLGVGNPAQRIDKHVDGHRGVEAVGIGREDMYRGGVDGHIVDDALYLRVGAQEQGNVALAHARGKQLLDGAQHLGTHGLVGIFALLVGYIGHAHISLA